MIENLPLVEKLFAAWRPWLGDDRDRYHNHVYRLVNLACAFWPGIGEEDFLLLEVAAAFHDLGIWRAESVDYLEPSADQACSFLARHIELGDRSLEEKQRIVREIIFQHHRLRALTEPESRLAEVFRKAHWVELTGGYLRFGLPRSRYEEIRRLFPFLGFHRRVLEFIGRRLKQRPFSPLPMLRP